MKRILAALLAVILTAPAAQAEGWTLIKRPAAGTGAGECALTATADNGATIELSMFDAARRKSRFTLMMQLAKGTRATIGVPDGKTFLSFASLGEKSTPITGKLRSWDDHGSFVHFFASLDDMDHFVSEIFKGPTVFVAQPDATPHVELLARFAVSESDKAMKRLLSCNFMP
ncbi:hypothetical protein [Vannielia sp. SX4]|uniref:hypothetical protein n=1 Tax=Vannielia sp. SX4 TaxID=3463852 RepID=UPI0040589048